LFFSVHSQADLVARESFEAYNQYLGLIDNTANREHLRAKVNFESALHDDVFNKFRDVSHRFRDALTNSFSNAMTISPN